MRKLFYLLAALWIAAVGTVKALDKELYGVKMASGEDFVLYLCYDEKRAFLGGETDWSVWKNDVTKVIFMESMQDARPTSTKAWFAFFTKLKEVENIERLNTSQVTDMMMMFYECSSLTSLDLSSFNTANVTAMQNMFEGCASLKELNLLWFDMDKVQTSNSMFRDCSSLTTIYCNTRWWNSIYWGPAEKYNYGDMFKGCTALKGDNGTECNGTDNLDIHFAHPDGENDEPGYFTHLDVEPELYAALEEDGNTMTFYYDGKRKMRHGKDNWAGWRFTVTKVVFDESFKDAKPESTNSWFRDFQILGNIEHLDYLNTEEVTDMNMMFYNCMLLTTLDVSHFNTAKVTDMGDMFFNCNGLTALDVSSFTTENVTSMAAMFTGCSFLESLDVSSFNTANVTTMENMFENCSELESIDVSGFNTEKVTDMENMFYNCMELKSLDLRNFNTANVTNFQYMFSDCSSLEKIFCDDDWSMSEIILDATDMFAGCTKLVGGKETTYDDSFVDIKYARKDGLGGKPGYFTGNELYAVLEADGTTLTLRYDTEREAKDGNVKWFDYSSNEALRNAVTKVVFDESVKKAKPESTLEWFFHFALLESIEHLDFLNTEEVTSMNSMFSSCEKLTSVDVSHFATGNVTDMNGMFYDCKSLTALDVSGFNTEKVTDMWGMFENCERLKSLDVTHFNTTNVADMSDMFFGCDSIKILDLRNFDMTNVTKTANMFMYCSNLQKIIFDGDWSTSGTITDSEDMFLNCPRLNGAKGTKYDAEHVDVAYARTDGLDDLPGYFHSAAVNLFTVKFFDAESNLIDEQLVGEGSAAAEPEEEDIPIIEHYHFTGWDKTFDNVTEDLNITAQYTIDTYTVTFVDYDGTELKSQTVDHGSAATAPADPERDGYTFTGWDPADFSTITSDLTVTAQYKQNPGTGIDQIVNRQSSNRKWIIDGRLFIEHNGKIIDATGRLVK